MIILSNVGWKSGLREWILQRFTGLYVGVYLFLLFIYLKFFAAGDFLSYSNIFSSFYFKISTIVFIFSLVLHSSIGMSIIFTDYIKNSILRVFIDFFVNIILLSYIFFIMQILWSFK
jgi:succinate dehydrogenase / fumarate reductase membrane anchor subunit